MRLIAYAYHADLYCTDCGADLPDVDPEGNDKHPVFSGAEADYIPHCAGCGYLIDGYSLTSEGVALALDAVACAAERRELTDTIEEWAGVLKDYRHGMRPGDYALVTAMHEGDVDAAHVIAMFYRDWPGDSLHERMPAALEEYWPW